MAAGRYNIEGHWAVALNAATVTGAGASVELPAVMGKFTLQTVVTGTPVSVSTTLEGSLDGTNWFVLATSTSVTGDAQHVVDKPVRFVRANLGTLTGGTAPTVTALVAATA